MRSWPLSRITPLPASPDRRMSLPRKCVWFAALALARVQKAVGRRSEERANIASPLIKASNFTLAYLVGTRPYFPEDSCHSVRRSDVVFMAEADTVCSALQGRAQLSLGFDLLAQCRSVCFRLSDGHVELEQQERRCGLPPRPMSPTFPDSVHSPS